MQETIHSCGPDRVALVATTLNVATKLGNKKHVFKRPLLFMGGMSCNGVYFRRNTQQTFCSHGSRSSLDALHVALNPDHARTVVWICSGGQGPYGKAFRSIGTVG